MEDPRTPTTSPTLIGYANTLNLASNHFLGLSRQGLAGSASYVHQKGGAQTAIGQGQSQSRSTFVIYLFFFFFKDKGGAHPFQSLIGSSQAGRLLCSWSKSGVGETKGTWRLVPRPRWLRPYRGACGLWWPAGGSCPGEAASATRTQEISLRRNETGTSCTSTRVRGTARSLSWTWRRYAHVRKRPRAFWRSARGS